MNRRKRKRLEEIERELPPRLRVEPKAGDNPLKRPYTKHARDIEILADLISDVTNEPQEYHFNPRDVRIPVRPHGVVFFHALDIQNLKLSTNNFVKGSPFCIYVELECQDIAKCSDPVYSIDTKKVRIDHSVHLTVELSEIRSDEKNDFLIHIYAFQDPEIHYLVGSQVIHIYEFVREIHGISTVEMVNDLTFHVGKFTFEFAWSYGAFGYGFSNQLRNPKSPIFESVNHSMFPRIALSPDDLVDNLVNTRIPKKLRLVTLHSLLVRKSHKDKGEDTQKAAIQTKKSKHKTQALDYEAKTVVFRRVKFSRGSPVHVSLTLDIHQKFMEDDFNQAYGEYICLRNRKDRLGWLGRMIEGRLRDRMEYDVGELFVPYDDVEDARKALSTRRLLACPPAFLEHNTPVQKIPCRPITAAKVDDDDMKFIHDKLASAPRFSGYLNSVFGFEKAPPKEPELESFKYEVDPKAGHESGQILKDTRSCCRRSWDAVQTFAFKCKLWFFIIYEFLFPTFEKEAEEKLPEISITLPSPQHSTTDFHSLSTQAQIFSKESDLEQTIRKAKTYLLMSRKSKKKLDDSDDEVDFESYRIPTRQFVGEDNKTKGRTRDDRALAHVEHIEMKNYNKKIPVDNLRKQKK